MTWWRRRERHAEAGEAQLPPDGPVIRLEHVSKFFRGDADQDTVALDDVTVDIARGDYVAISGPSGCGKSTFLSILALLDTPTRGRYWLNGRATDTLAPGERARVRNLDVGLVFQSFNLIADMTVFENVEYPLTLRGVAPADRKARVDAALDRVGLTPRAKQHPSSLSGGHQQLVAVARAITGRPAVLLADEPTGNLDSKSGEALMQMFGEIHAAGATICLATHDPRWVAAAKRHLYLLDGRLVDAPPDAEWS
ncbi:MAG TPA: ABC transporter ATP-binding protein [Vicinamibacterales bacterium]|nr:ABC transporter ATP-binding protein [Vicinamibacterales bacterium]